MDDDVDAAWPGDDMAELLDAIRGTPNCGCGKSGLNGVAPNPSDFDMAEEDVPWILAATATGGGEGEGEPLNAVTP